MTYTLSIVAARKLRTILQSCDIEHLDDDHRRFFDAHLEGVEQGIAEDEARLASEERLERAAAALADSINSRRA